MKALAGGAVGKVQVGEMAEPSWIVSHHLPLDRRQMPTGISTPATTGGRR